MPRNRRPLHFCDHFLSTPPPFSAQGWPPLLKGVSLSLNSEKASIDKTKWQILTFILSQTTPCVPHPRFQLGTLKLSCYQP